MVVKFRNTIWPPPPQLSLHRRAALSSNSNGTRSVYSRENPKSILYCEMSMKTSHSRSLILHIKKGSRRLGPLQFATLPIPQFTKPTNKMRTPAVLHVKHSLYIRERGRRLHSGLFNIEISMLRIGSRQRRITVVRKLSTVVRVHPSLTHSLAPSPFSLISCTLRLL
jgi:hypothetical protein